MSAHWRRWLALAGLLGGLLSPALSPALDSDRRQPMLIEADSAEIDDQEGVSIYRGEVVIRQGSLEMHADVITLYSVDDEVVKAIAEGRPATFQQRPEGQAEPIHAEALRIEFYADQDRLILLDQAQARQRGDRFESNRIVYDIRRDLVNAGQLGGQDRVRITIQPRD